MGQIDRSVGQERLFPYGRPMDSSASVRDADIMDLSDDDPLVAARGAVNGVIFGLLLWIVILWAVL